MKTLYLVYSFLLLTLIGICAVLFSGQINFHLHWQTADRSSAHLAPDPKITKGAVIQVYSARAFNWRGLFAVHTWIAVKPKDATHYIVYQVIGWRIFYGKPALMQESDIPDRNWFGQKPKIILDIRGATAEKLIPEIQKASDTYPYPNEYQLWPGPNSNTFTAYVARQVPELGLSLPANAIGKDFLTGKTVFARAPSGTGYQISLYGLFGVIFAKKEGLEINILGLVFGFSPVNLGIKMPGVGQLSIL